MTFPVFSTANVLQWAVCKGLIEYKHIASFERHTGVDGAMRMPDGPRLVWPRHMIQQQCVYVDDIFNYPPPHPRLALRGMYRWVPILVYWRATKEQRVWSLQEISDYIDEWARSHAK